MSNFPNFDFKIDCGDDPAVRQWLHDNGVKWMQGQDQDPADYMPSIRLIFCESRLLTECCDDKDYFDCYSLPLINPYDFMQPATPSKPRPFYIRHTPDMADAQVAAVFDKAVSVGAELLESVLGIHSTGFRYSPSAFEVFGVADGFTCFFRYADEISTNFKDAKEIRLKDVDEWLGIAPKQKPNDNELVISKWDRLADVLPNGNDGSMPPLGIKGVMTVKLRDGVEVVPGQLVCHSQFDAVQVPTVAERMAALIEQYKADIPDWARFVYVSLGSFTAVEHDPRPAPGKSETIAILSDTLWARDWRETLTELPTVKRELIVAHDHPVDTNKTIDNMAEIAARDTVGTPSKYEAAQQAKVDALAAQHKAAEPKTLTIPSTLPSEQAMPMMLGGQFGGNHGDR